MAYLSQGRVQIKKIHESVRTAIDLWEATDASVGVEIVGILGFSQGAVAATLLMWQQQNGELVWLPRLRFGVLICSDLTQEVVDHLNEGARRSGAEAANLDQPTLHIHGLRDPYLGKGRRMLEVYQNDAMRLIEFDGGHHCPNQPKDCERASQAIREVAKTAGIFQSSQVMMSNLSTPRSEQCTVKNLP